MPMKITSEFWQELKARQRDRKVTITRILGVISPTLVIIASLRNLNLNFTFWSFMIVASICLILINLVLLILKR
ncbi:hypothetical protein BACCAP_01411 [Pseudoflavonifractor capillosus ATCC 29799]|jgi:hypothetical protein|uniref:Uncharacterized protein n=1 Tax=Pseudoflavonifractor capillosus ATCC 29799 TaxID=411467 RepID=A6NT82_9FIRM|nr:hypothetical protein [Pseudoflavonifractor capillosus]EDN00645.1 hypothetical protein BACCAP_01411 [Pseudoflavonifractor capillosus ATCC 29799]